MGQLPPGGPYTVDQLLALIERDCRDVLTVGPGEAPWYVNPTTVRVLALRFLELDDHLRSGGNPPDVWTAMERFEPPSDDSNDERCVHCGRLVDRIGSVVCDNCRRLEREEDARFQRRGEP